MPVLEMSDNIVPRSAVRHRPIHTDDDQSTSTMTPLVQRAHRPRPTPVQTGDEQGASPGQGHVSQKPGTSARPSPSRQRTRFRRAHPLLYLGLGMLLMLALWIGVTQVVTWATNEINTWKYGYPRTYQVDAFVGHNESAGTPSHFIAINLHGHIEVIELPGGDAAHARIYAGPQLFGEGSDLVPVTLQFADVNGDHKPDLIVSFQQGSHIAYINDQGGFRPLRPDEQGPVEQWLQRQGE